MEGTTVQRRLTWQEATVTAATQETPAVRTLELAAPAWPGHSAGQHLDVRLTAEDGYTAERSYPIASAPGEPVAITVERLEDGEVSPYLTGELRVGDELELRGPVGVYAGRVDAALLGGVAWPADKKPLAFVRGPASFVEAVAEGLVGLGYRPGWVKTERFGGTGGP
jgi:ferredoxin-NADP reductase